MIKRRATPGKTPPIDAKRIRELVHELAEARAAGASVHGHPAQNDIGDLAGCWGAYYVQSMLNHPDGPKDPDPIADYIIEHAAAWKEQHERLWGCRDTAS